MREPTEPSGTWTTRAAGTMADWCANLRPAFGRSIRRLRGGEPLASIFQQVFVGLAEVSLEGHLLSANERFCRLVERTPDALSRLRLQDVLHTGDLAAYDAAMTGLARGGGAFTQEARLLTPDRRIVPVDLSAAPLRDGSEDARSAALVFVDIGPRKCAEARAAESERRFRDVADAAPIYIWIAGTDRSRRHTWVNSRWADFRGRPAGDELGAAWMDGVHADDLDRCLTTYAAAFDRHEPFTAEYRWLRAADGTYRWMLDTGTPIYEEHGRFAGYIGSLIDITDRKADEAEREALLAAEIAARTDAERANRLKEEFLSILSHELRTPLNAVLGWVHVLQASVGGVGEIGRGLGVIERNARLQSRMIDDLLDLGGVITGKMRLEMRMLAIDQVVDAALESLQPAFDAKGVRLRRVAGADAGCVYGDASRLQQVVWNVLSNALKFTSAGGEVTVEVRKTGASVRLVIRDNGQGIEPDFLPYVFDRFRQSDASTRRSHGGLGVGLALVKSLSELHGGSVSAESDGLGAGATFTVTLPAAGGESAHESPLVARALNERSEISIGERV